MARHDMALWVQHFHRAAVVVPDSRTSRAPVKVGPRIGASASMWLEGRSGLEDAVGEIAPVAALVLQRVAQEAAGDERPSHDVLPRLSWSCRHRTRHN